MSHRSLPAAALALAFSCAFAAGDARAAEAYDNCTGFITTLPAVLSTQGVWCLAHDVSFAPDSGNAIEVVTNNVTIDCNGFKVGNLAAGTGSMAYGVHAENRRNVTIRGCNLRGFGVAIGLYGSGGGHIVEDNRSEGALFVGIVVTGDNSVIRRNQVADVGPTTALSDFNAAGISAFGTSDVIDNAVSFVEAAGAGDSAGIYGGGHGAVFRGNRVREVTAPAGIERGIYPTGGVSVRDNHLQGRGSAGSIGIACDPALPTPARDNTVMGFETSLADCTPALDNLTFGLEL